MIMEVNPVQPSKASSPIEVTELGIVMEGSPEQCSKAYCPIKVTELGMVMAVRLVQP